MIDGVFVDGFELAVGVVFEEVDKAVVLLVFIAFGH